MNIIFHFFFLFGNIFFKTTYIACKVFFRGRRFSSKCFRYHKITKNKINKDKFCVFIGPHCSCFTGEVCLGKVASGHTLGLFLIHCFLFDIFQLTRKNLMAKNLKRLKKQLEREFGKLEAAKYPCLNKYFYNHSQWLCQMKRHFCGYAGQHYNK